MGTRVCEVWMVYKQYHMRLKDLIQSGHSKHECVRTRQFAQEHEGDHQCSCGMTWAKQKTDND